MNNHLHPIFKDILNSNLKQGVVMHKDQKDILNLVMQYVSYAEEHHLDEDAIELEVEDIISEIQALAIRIEEGEFDRFDIEEMKEDEGCRKYHQRKDDEITG